MSETGEAPAPEAGPRTGSAVTGDVASERDGRASLGANVRSGARWQFVDQTLEVAMAIGMTVVLARAVGPRLYGFTILAYTVVSVASTVLTSPVSTAIVALRLNRQRELNAAWWLALLPALALFSLLSVGSLAFASGTQSATWAAVVAWLPLQAAAGVSMARLQEAMRFRALSLCSLTAAATANGTALGLVVAGRPLLALVVRILAIPALQWLLCTAVARWSPTLGFDREAAARVIAYVRGVVGFNFLNQLVRNGDNLLVGAVLGSAQLGFYSIAYRFIELPVSQVGLLSSTVSLPALSRMDSAESFKRAFLRVQKIILWAFAPIGICSVILGDLAVRDVLGDKWASAGTIVRIFGLIALAQVSGTQVGAIYLTRRATDLYLRWGMASTAVFAVCIFGGLPWGITGVALGYLVFTVVLFYPSWAIPGRLVGLRPLELLRAIRIEVGVAALVIAIALVARALTAPWSPGAVVGVAVIVTAMYWVTVLLLDWSLRREVIALARPRLFRRVRHRVAV